MIEVRRTARALLLDGLGRVLLLRIHDPVVTRGPDPIPADFWLLPGGGVTGGESWQDAARRELFEETGISGADVGRCVRAHGKVIATGSGGLWHVFEQIHVARVTGTPQVRFGGPEEHERATLRGFASAGGRPAHTSNPPPAPAISTRSQPARAPNRPGVRSYGIRRGRRGRTGRPASDTRSSRGTGPARTRTRA